MTNNRYTVYEAANGRLREFYLGFSASSMVDTINSLGTDAPRAIRHWKVTDIEAIRSVEFDLTEAQARDFIREYLGTRSRQGWRYVTEETARHDDRGVPR